MSKQLEGRLVRFEKNGVGVVDVKGIDQYVYFTPKDIAGYGGQTVGELKSIRHGQWTDGKIVIIKGDVRPTGNVRVESVTLKG
jgi:hypothetical protein